MIRVGPIRFYHLHQRPILGMLATRRADNQEDARDAPAHHLTLTRSNDKLHTRLSIFTKS